MHESKRISNGKIPKRTVGEYSCKQSGANNLNYLLIVCGKREDEGMFPHLYNGGRLGKDEVESMAVWENDGTNWDTALRKAESWLLY
jgi:hypothetical protein